MKFVHYVQEVGQSLHTEYRHFYQLKIVDLNVI